MHSARYLEFFEPFRFEIWSTFCTVSWTYRTALVRNLVCILHGILDPLNRSGSKSGVHSVRYLGLIEPLWFDVWCPLHNTSVKAFSHGSYFGSKFLGSVLGFSRDLWRQISRSLHRARPLFQNLGSGGSVLHVILVCVISLTLLWLYEPIEKSVRNL